MRSPPSSTVRISRRSGNDQNRRLWPDPPVTSRSLRGPNASTRAGSVGLARQGAGRPAVAIEQQDPAVVHGGRGEPTAVRAEGHVVEAARVLWQVEVPNHLVEGQDASHGPAPQGFDRKPSRLGRVEQTEAAARVSERGGRIALEAGASQCEELPRLGAEGLDPCLVARRRCLMT